MLKSFIIRTRRAEEADVQVAEPALAPAKPVPVVKLKRKKGPWAENPWVKREDLTGKNPY